MEEFRYNKVFANNKTHTQYVENRRGIRFGGLTLKGSIHASFVKLCADVRINDKKDFFLEYYIDLVDPISDSVSCRLVIQNVDNFICALKKLKENIIDMRYAYKYRNIEIFCHPNLMMRTYLKNGCEFNDLRVCFTTYGGILHNTNNLIVFYETMSAMLSPFTYSFSFLSEKMEKVRQGCILFLHTYSFNILHELIQLCLKCLMREKTQQEHTCINQAYVFKKVWNVLKNNLCNDMFNCYQGLQYKNALFDYNSTRETCRDMTKLVIAKRKFCFSSQGVPLQTGNVFSKLLENQHSSSGTMYCQ